MLWGRFSFLGKGFVVRLQVAMDVLDLPSALTLAGQVAEYVDVLELGTPLVKSAGISAVSAVKAAHPDKL
ncbi:orotidine 5'-phosphate decarboxylase / HUMPS family protein, partial [Prauserella rugosa]